MALKVDVGKVEPVLWQSLGKIGIEGQRFQRLLQEDFNASEGISWEPVIDVFKKGSYLVVKADFSNIKPEDIDVFILGDTLGIKSQKRVKTTIENSERCRPAHSHKDFFRSIPLPFVVNPDSVETTYKKGILEITIPG